jgi:hypothetical protein
MPFSFLVPRRRYPHVLGALGWGGSQAEGAREVVVEAAVVQRSVVAVSAVREYGACYKRRKVPYATTVN